MIHDRTWLGNGVKKIPLDKGIITNQKKKSFLQGGKGKY